MDNLDNTLVLLQAHKDITTLYKGFLELVEDVSIDNPSVFTPEKLALLRKKILDAGNETERSLLGFLSYFDYAINKEKVNSAYNKKIIKRFTTSMPIMEIQ